MLSENDKQNLLRNLVRNRVVLVTGAGFSMSASNKHGEHLPNGWKLAERLWGFLYDDPYDKTSSMKILYGAALRSRKGLTALRAFVADELSATVIPDWYSLVAKWYWRRIYTFNADDVLEKVYARQTRILERIIAPSNFMERDQFLHSIQYIKLHGSIDSDKDLTFGPREYATRAAMRADMWYLHFVTDYSTMPTVFIGTELDEPLFWQYIEMRGSQEVNGQRIRRPKCFLVSPHISRPSEQHLAEYNIVSIRDTAEKFFMWLDQQLVAPTREDVLRLIDDGLEPALAAAQRGASMREIKNLEYFLSIFRTPVRVGDPRPNTLFLLGAPPTWDDISGDIDAHRDITETIKAKLRDGIEKKSFDILRLSSAAGGGKSTLCRRLALELVDEGYNVYFSDGTLRPNPTRLADHISKLPPRTFLFLDNAGDDFSSIGDLWRKVQSLEHRPFLVVSARANDVAFHGFDLERNGARVEDVAIPNLTDADILNIIATLDKHDLLGTLKDKSDEERLRAFRDKAKKQILVAMREATSGRGFDEILRDEFRSVKPDEAKLLYLICALASSDDYGMTVQQMIVAMNLPPNETQFLVEKSLSGILVQYESDASTYFIRHPAIAHFIISKADRELLAEAVIGLMSALASVMPDGPDRKASRAFRLYRRLLSHTLIFERFGDRDDLARAVYEGIKSLYRDDGHYWLHYGAYEIEHGGDIALAENYLDQADALLPNSRKVETAQAHLLFKKARMAESSVAANALAEEAQRILRNHMSDSATVSFHALHIFGIQMADFIRRWLPAADQSEAYRRVARELQNATPPHMLNHRELNFLIKDLKRLELETVVKRRGN
jgi:hypothetical protein